MNIHSDNLPKCKFCGNPYYPNSISDKKDYGFCSRECAINSKQPCPNCGERLVWRDNEKPTFFVRRVFCSRHCGIVFSASKPKSEETRQRLSNSRKAFEKTELGKENAKQRGEKFKTWLATDAGKKHITFRNQCQREWINSDAGIEWRKQVNASRDNPEYRTRASQLLKDFFASRKGIELRKQFSAMYTGKPRPADVTKKMKDSLEAFWNSPEGVSRAAEISARMTENLPDAPYGPNWGRQRQKTISRDQFTCQICGINHIGDLSLLHVHHIYNRRLFGYVLGVNDHFRWANHLHNLISLCNSCHKKVENKTAFVPEHFQVQADLHYQQFVVM